MAKPIKISIPKPCHENWEEMTPMEKGRFCASCQQQVHDFTNSSDREIAEFYKQNKNSCGRFLDSQLNRNLVVPNKKNSFWVAAGIAITSLFTLYPDNVTAQETEITQGPENKTIGISKVNPKPLIIKWKVVDFYYEPIAGATIKIPGTDIKTFTDSEGYFTMEVSPNDEILIKHKGKRLKTVVVAEEKERNIVLKTRKEKKMRALMGRFF